MGTAVDPDNPHLRGNYKPWGSYGQAKLSNYYFGLGLQRKLEAAGSGVKSLIAHPGLTNTDLQSHTVEEGGGGFIATLSDKLADLVGMSPEHGARMQLRAAHRPRRRGRRAVRPAVRQQRPGGEATRAAHDRHDQGDRHPLGRLRA